VSDALAKAWEEALWARTLEVRALSSALVDREAGELELERSYRRSLWGEWVRASPQDLQRVVCGARVVFVGDHRALPSFSPRVREILRAMGRGRVILAVGRSATRASARQHAMLAGLGDLAAEVLPLDTRGPLAKRLEKAARRLAAASRRFPGARLLVVAGELLLAPAGLPRALARLAPHLLPGVVVHRDPFPLDRLRTWERPLPEIWRRGKHFASLELHPLLIEEAFVARRRGERELLDPADIAGSFHSILSRVAAALGTLVPPSALRVPVRLVTDPVVPTLLARLGDAAFYALAEIRRGESLFLSRPRAVLLSTLSASDAAEEAAHLLRATMGGTRDPRRRGEILYARALHEALGYAGAALVFGRRASLGDSLLARMEQGGGPEAEGARLTRRVEGLEGLGLGNLALAEAEGASDPALLVAAHLLGYRLAARICQGPQRPRLWAGLLWADFASPGAAPRLWRALRSMAHEWGPAGGQTPTLRRSPAPRAPR
jgi:hypothetical protein